jgi:hypothetical protein
MVGAGGNGHVREKPATRHRQWAANAFAAAMRTTSWADRETLLMIARQHLTRALKTERLCPPTPDGLSRHAKSTPARH